MRRAFAAAQLIAVLTALAPACVAGTDRIADWRPAATDRCLRRAAVARTPCGPQLKSQAPRCGLRSFTQLPIAALPAAEAPALPVQADKVHPLPHTIVIVSSVGPPETDRGPPVRS